MKRLIYGLLLLILAGCALLRNTHKTTEKSTQSGEQNLNADVTSETQSKVDNQQLILKNDDAKSDYTIRFWPKGELKFLPDGGFAGEFDSVQMKGSQHKISGSEEHLNSVDTETQKTSAKLTEEGKKSARRDGAKETGSPNIKAVIAVIVALIIIISLLFYVKKYR